MLSLARLKTLQSPRDLANFLAKGGVINFVNVGGQIRFQISIDAAAREKLSVSSHLLQVAVPLGQSISAFSTNNMRLTDAPR